MSHRVLELLIHINIINYKNNIFFYILYFRSVTFVFLSPWMHHSLSCTSCSIQNPRWNTAKEKKMNHCVWWARWNLSHYSMMKIFPSSWLLTIASRLLHPIIVLWSWLRNQTVQFLNESLNRLFEISFKTAIFSQIGHCYISRELIFTRFPAYTELNVKKNHILCYVEVSQSLKWHTFSLL